MYKRQILAITVLIAIICVAITFLGIYLSGIRYIKIDTDGGGYIKFFGRVDSLGAPSQGRLYYSDGTTAEVDMATGTVTYSNGDVYVGELKNLLKHGQGKMTFATGDVYELSLIHI